MTDTPRTDRYGRPMFTPSATSETADTPALTIKSHTSALVDQQRFNRCTATMGHDAAGWSCTWSAYDMYSDLSDLPVMTGAGRIDGDHNASRSALCLMLRKAIEAANAGSRGENWPNELYTPASVERFGATWELMEVNLHHDIDTWYMRIRYTGTSSYHPGSISYTDTSSHPGTVAETAIAIASIMAYLLRDSEDKL